MTHIKLDNNFFDSIQEQAENSPRRRMNYDLRTSAEDSSQRMINVLMSDTVVPIHRHTETSETVVVCRGAIREEFYDDQGHKTEEFILRAGGECQRFKCPKECFTLRSAWRMAASSSKPRTEPISQSRPRTSYRTPTSHLHNDTPRREFLRGVFFLASPSPPTNSTIKNRQK